MADVTIYSVLTDIEKECAPLLEVPMLDRQAALLLYAGVKPKQLAKILSYTVTYLEKLWETHKTTLSEMGRNPLAEELVETYMGMVTRRLMSIKQMESVAEGNARDTALWAKAQKEMSLIGTKRVDNVERLALAAPKKEASAGLDWSTTASSSEKPAPTSQET